MIKKTAAFILSAVIFSGSAYAAQGIGGSQMQIITGKIFLIDWSNGVLTVEKPPMRRPASDDNLNKRAETVSFSFDKWTAIVSSEGRHLKPEALSVGKPVKVQYENRAGRSIARAISVGAKTPQDSQ